MAGLGRDVAEEGASAPVVVLSALNLEYRAMRVHLSGLSRVTHVLGTGFEVGKLPGVDVPIVLGRTGEGNVAAAVLAGRAIEAFRPRAVLFVGVAGALKGEVRLGDVVVATRVYAVHGGKEEGGRLLARPRSFETAHELLDIARYLDSASAWGAAAAGGSTAAFRVHFRPVAAGEVVLNSRETPLARQLYEHYNDAAAVEMEGAGIAAAAHLSRATPVLTVRGISDRADGLKHAADAAGGQDAAAAHAAQVAAAVIREWTTTNSPQAPFLGAGEPPYAGSVVRSAQPADAEMLPCQLGVLPPEAECFQERAVSGLLEVALGGGSTAVLCQVLSGAGGMGKTQVAAHYARSRWAAEELDVLVWLTADSRASVLAEYARAATMVGVPVAAQDAEAAARGFVSWLATTRHTWLVVLDDLANPGVLTDLWPPAHPRGRAVVTTRRQDAALTGSGRRLVTVDVFTEAEAEAYVTAKLAAHGRFEDSRQVAGLARDLGFLPVALAQAVAYLLDAGLDCARYRARWTDRRRALPRLVPHPEALPDDQRTGLAAVWSLSVQRANALEPVGLAAPMLELAALLDSNGIPLDVLTSLPALEYLSAYRSASQSTDVRGSEVPVNAEDAEDALSALVRLSLCTLDREDGRRMVRVHALIQRATRETLTRQRLAEAARAAASALVRTWPETIRDDGIRSLALRGCAKSLNDSILSTDRIWIQAGAIHCPVPWLAGWG